MPAWPRPRRLRGNAASSSPQRSARRRRRTLPTCRRAGARALGQDGRRGARGGANACASRRAPIEQGGRQFARLVCEFRLARGIAVHLRAQAGGFCFSFLVTLENRDAASYILQPSFGFFPSRPARDPTPNAEHQPPSRPVCPLQNLLKRLHGAPADNIFSRFDSLGIPTARRTPRRAGPLGDSRNSKPTPGALLPLTAPAPCRGRRLLTSRRWRLSPGGVDSSRKTA